MKRKPTLESQSQNQSQKPRHPGVPQTVAYGVFDREFI